MASNNELFYKVGHLTGLSTSDLHSDNARGAQTARPGTIAYLTDAFGYRIVKYVKNMVGSTNAMGELMAYESDGANVRSTSITASAAGTTTSIVTTGLTANDHVDQIVFCVDDAGAAGAAPEGEASVVASNSTTTINLNADYAYSAATATNDTFDLISTYHSNDSVDGDEAWTIQGVVLGKDGIQDNQFGWVQLHGVTPCLKIGLAGDVTEGDPIVAGAAGVDAFGSDGHELWIGVAVTAYNAGDSGNSSMVVDMRLFAYENTGGTP